MDKWIPLGLGVWVLFFFYFIPTTLAVVRSAKSVAGIAIINAFLGWTLLGWVGALAWAAVAEKKPRHE